MLELRDRVVIMLLFKQHIVLEQVEQAWETWKQMPDAEAPESLWRVLTLNMDIERDKIFECAAEVYAFEHATIDDSVTRFVGSAEKVFTQEQWVRMGELSLVPIHREKSHRDERWIFATPDPTNADIPHFLKELGLAHFELRYVPEAAAREIIGEKFPLAAKNEFMERVNQDPGAFDLGTTYQEQAGLIDEDALEAEIGRSSLINLFEATLVEAVRRGVSDVHIYPNKNRQIEIHFRVDGELNRWYTEERVHPEAFLAVVKDNAMNVDRFERDSAQDGFIQRTVDNTLIRFRVSVLPIANASPQVRSESIVIRVLDDRKVITDLSRLGLLEQSKLRFEWAIRQPYGMVILTGPTGSGKTTTLYACLNQVVTPKVNVLTVEDPVEYIIHGVRQIKLNAKLGLEGAIRAILRHDPDIVMVGEMRDRPTADLAIKLANTGHLTFSTLHTNDAPSAVSRLYKMGVEPFLIANAINLVVAQRLIRTLCAVCKRPMAPENLEPAMLKRAGFTEEEIESTTFYETGRSDCKNCRGLGYKGRRAITETLQFTRAIRELVVDAEDNINEESIRSIAIREGMLTLQDSAREVVRTGETSLEELFRVVATDL